MEINEAVVLDDRGCILVNGREAKDFLQNIVTNDISKITDKFTIFSSILTPQGKYLYEFFISKLKNDYLIECEKESVKEIINIFEFYKLRSRVDFLNLTNKYTSIIISLENFNNIYKSDSSRGLTINYDENTIFIDPRSEKLGAKIILKTEHLKKIIKKMNLKVITKDNYYSKSFDLGIPQVNLKKLKSKIFGIENNLDELGGIDFKKGCYIGQENTSRIKLRNKLRRRILPIKKISGEIYDNDIIKYKNNEIGKVMIEKPYPFALVKVVDPEINEFINTELNCGKSKVKIIKPEWI